MLRDLSVKRNRWSDKIPLTKCVNPTIVWGIYSLFSYKQQITQFKETVLEGGYG